MKRHLLTAIALGVAGGVCSSTIAQETANQTSTPAVAKASEPGKEMMKDVKQVRLSKLMGVNVTSKDGDSLGQVQDLVFNPQSGKIRFALVGKGFMAGLGETLIPVPWQAIDIAAEREFALKLDKQKLSSAPTWSQSQETEKPDYIIRIYRFYEIEPVTEMGGPGESGQQSGSGEGGSQRSQSQPDQSSSDDE
jgi:sporulation protein YlmC with PRC-barrel domain